MSLGGRSQTGCSRLVLCDNHRRTIRPRSSDSAKYHVRYGVQARLNFINYSFQSQPFKASQYLSVPIKSDGEISEWTTSSKFVTIGEGGGVAYILPRLDLSKSISYGPCHRRTWKFFPKRRHNEPLFQPRARSLYGRHTSSCITIRHIISLQKGPLKNSCVLLSVDTPSILKTENTMVDHTCKHDMFLQHSRTCWDVGRSRWVGYYIERVRESGRKYFEPIHKSIRVDPASCILLLHNSFLNFGSHISQMLLYFPQRNWEDLITFTLFTRWPFTLNVQLGNPITLHSRAPIQHRHYFCPSLPCRHINSNVRPCVARNPLWREKW